MRKIHILLVTAVYIFILSSVNVIPVYAEQAKPDINAPYAVLMDIKSGQILYEKNADVKAYPASTTKIMTGILALESGNMSASFTASDEAVNSIEPGGMIAGIKAGEVIRLEDLLNALLVKSANECGNIIAEGLAGSVKNFAGKMTEKAKEIGALNTQFTNPHGLHEYEHYTTASDLARIARYAMQNPEFRKIVKQDEYTLPPTNINPNPVTVYSTNKFVLEGSQYYTRDALGIKTGYTDEAMSCLVSGMSKNGVELLAVVLKERDRQSVYEDSLRMYKYGFENFEEKTVLTTGQILSKTSVSDALDTDTVELMSMGEIRALMPKDNKLWNIRQELDILSDITAPVSIGDELGYIKIYQGNTLLGTVPLAASTTILKKPAPKKANAFMTAAVNFVKFIFGVVVVLAGFLLFIPLLRRVVRNVQRTVRTRNQ